MQNSRALFLLLNACLLLASLPASADEAQLQTGEALYATHCASCHGANLSGSAHGTALTGQAFLDKWGDKGSLDLLRYNMANMPPGGNSTLGEGEHLALVSLILSRSTITQLTGPITTATNLSLKSGEVMQGNSEALDSWSDAGTINEIAKSRSAFTNRTVENFKPVTQAMLNAPDDGDWLSWRRTADGSGFSPLQQVNTQNVQSLTLAWVIAMKDGSNQGTPLVHDGIMYLTHPGNIIQALDAATGDLIWEYAYDYPPAAQTLGGPTKNIAIFGNRIFLSTYDAAIVAIDARTGEQVWRTAKADYTQGYTHTAGPIIGDGVVISGINGCERYKVDGCFLTGHDAETGRELWRTSTIAMPGDPGDGTWPGQAPEFRAGGDMWVAGSYDPALNLFYIGTSQAKPWVAASRGMSAKDAALYTNSTLAIEPKTGKIRWHFQHIPGETIDMETGFERVLIDSKGERWVFTIGKDGVLWKLDRTDGQYLAHAETLPQNLYTRIDPETGRVTYRQDIIDAKIGDPIKTCPGIYGGHNWQAMAFSPADRSLIIPLHNLCSDLVGRKVERAVGAGGYGGDSRVYEMPGVDGQLGKLAAWDVDSMKLRWAHQQRAMFMTGVLTTAGGLAFVGDLDRRFKAFDTSTGKVLWQARLGAPTHGFPISYAVDGEQYIAVPTGMGVFRAMTAVMSPDIHQPANGQALYVFKLPKNNPSRK